MELNLKNKRVLIVGASKGIGKTIAMEIFKIAKPLEAREGEAKDYSLLSTHLAFRKPFKVQLEDLKQWMLDHPKLYGEYQCLKNR